jgi:predicted dehydrogenase
VHRNELVEFQVDGTDASAVAGLRECRVQRASTTPRPVWDPDSPPGQDFRAQWQLVPAGVAGGCFRSQWELFLEHLVTGAPFRHDLLSGAEGVQLAELGLQSWREGRKLGVPALPP